MNKNEEKLAVFWCNLLAPILYDEIEPDLWNRYIQSVCDKPILFPDGTLHKPSPKTLKRKLKKYRKYGFDALARKRRKDKGSFKAGAPEVIAKAIELKREQPFRSVRIINGYLYEMFGTTIPRSTMYRHFKQAGATRLKLGAVVKKVRKRWSRDHTHSLWIGDFEEGPYVVEKGEVVPTCLSAFIDCHSRYVVEARYYYRQNLDVLIDSLIRAFSVHGAPKALYLDNAKVYHSNGLVAACHRLQIQLIHRPPRDPAPGGAIERFFQTAQIQLEKEVRAGHILSLDELNQTLRAWLSESYHASNHSELKMTPKQMYDKGLAVIRKVDLSMALESFLETYGRTVNKDFSDVRVNNRFYKVDPKLRGDKVNVRIDPFSALDTVKIESPDEVYLGQGMLHTRDKGDKGAPFTPEKPKHDLKAHWIRQHNKRLEETAHGIDFRKINSHRPWPFHDFANTTASLLGRKGKMTDFNAGELEALKKVYNQSVKINRVMLQRACETAPEKTLTYLILELKKRIQKEEN